MCRWRRRGTLQAYAAVLRARMRGRRPPANADCSWRQTQASAGMLSRAVALHRTIQHDFLREPGFSPW